MRMKVKFLQTWDDGAAVRELVQNEAGRDGGV